MPDLLACDMPALLANLAMPKKPPTTLTIEIAVRLRVLQAEMGKTDEAMADMLGVGRKTWTNWKNLESLPDEAAMIRLADLGKVDMNWIYRGSVSGLPLGHAIRLSARLQGMDPDKADASVLMAPPLAPDRVAEILGKASRHLPLGKAKLAT